MDTVPLELQRKCEQRWAARYRRPLEPHRLEQANDEADQLDNQLSLLAGVSEASRKRDART